MPRPFATGVAAAVAALAMILPGAGPAEDAPESGLKPGAFVGPFLVDDITGPNKGDTLCYR